MQKQAEPEQLIENLENNELLDERATCAFYGGVRPIHRATLMRGVRSGRIPKPIKVTPNSNRWRRSELQETLERSIAARKETV
jgi:predicted DNA-binding transcriptional regulator AlpA